MGEIHTVLAQITAVVSVAVKVQRMALMLMLAAGVVAAVALVIHQIMQVRGVSRSWAALAVVAAALLTAATLEAGDMTVVIVG
jgi:predicted PurR-regulated permease PerM